MDRLTGPTRTYKSHDTAGLNDRGEAVDLRVAIKLLNREMAPEVIKLKVRNLLASGATTHQSSTPQIGCQVMLIKVKYSPGNQLRRARQREISESRSWRIGQWVHRPSR